MSNVINELADDANAVWTLQPNYPVATTLMEPALLQGIPNNRRYTECSCVHWKEIALLALLLHKGRDPEEEEEEEANPRHDVSLAVCCAQTLCFPDYLTSLGIVECPHSENINGWKAQSTRQLQPFFLWQRVYAFAAHCPWIGSIRTSLSTALTPEILGRVSVRKYQSEESLRCAQFQAAACGQLDLLAILLQQDSVPSDWEESYIVGLVLHCMSRPTRWETTIVPRFFPSISVEELSTATNPNGVLLIAAILAGHVQLVKKWWSHAITTEQHWHFSNGGPSGTMRLFSDLILPILLQRRDTEMFQCIVNFVPSCSGGNGRLWQEVTCRAEFTLMKAADIESLHILDTVVQLNAPQMPDPCWFVSRALNYDVLSRLCFAREDLADRHGLRREEPIVDPLQKAYRRSLVIDLALGTLSESWRYHSSPVTVLEELFRFIRACECDESAAEIIETHCSRWSNPFCNEIAQFAQSLNATSKIKSRIREHETGLRTMRSTIGASRGLTYVRCISKATGFPVNVMSGPRGDDEFSKLVVANTGDFTATVYDNTLHPRRRIQGTFGLEPFVSVQLSQSSEFAVYATADAIGIANLSQGVSMSRVMKEVAASVSKSITAMAITSDDRVIIVGQKTGSITLYNTLGVPKFTWAAHDVGAVAALHVRGGTSTTEYFVSGSTEGQVNVFDVKKFQRRIVFGQHPVAIAGIASFCSPGSDIVGCVSGDIGGNAFLWMFDKSTLDNCNSAPPLVVVFVRFYDDPIVTICMSADEKLLLVVTTSSIHLYKAPVDVVQGLKQPDVWGKDADAWVDNKSNTPESLQLEVVGELYNLTNVIHEANASSGENGVSPLKVTAAAFVGFIPTAQVCVGFNDGATHILQLDIKS